MAESSSPLTLFPVSAESHCEIHKESRNGVPPFGPIFSAIGTPTYKLAKFLLMFLTPSTAN